MLVVAGGLTTTSPDNVTTATTVTPNLSRNDLALIETRRSRMQKSARRLGSLLDALRVCNRTTGGSVEAKNSSIAPNVTSSFSGLPACVSPRSRFCKASIAA